jgi:MFS family permease
MVRALDRSIDVASQRALGASWLGWMFDGYETYALVLVAAIAVHQLVAADQQHQLPLYIGGVLSATLVGWATGGVIAGILADYVGRKRMLTLSIVCYALFAGLTALSPNYWLFLVFRFLTGLGIGAEWGPGAAIVAEVWPPAGRGRAAAVLQCAIGFGALLASGVWLVLGPLSPAAWRYMFVLGVLPALLVLYIRTHVQEPDLWLAADERRRAARWRAAQGQELSAEEPGLLQFTMTHLLRTPVLRRRLIPLLLMSLSTVVGWWSVSARIPEYGGQIAASVGYHALQWATYTGLCYTLGSIAGLLGFGFLADAWGRKLTTWMFFLDALIMVELFFRAVTAPSLLLIAAAVNSIFTAGLFTWMPVYLPELFPTYMRGTAMSLVFDNTRYLAACGPLLAGWLITALGGIGHVALMIGLIYILGLIITPWVGPETKGQPLPA